MWHRDCGDVKSLSILGAPGVNHPSELGKSNRDHHGLYHVRLRARVIVENLARFPAELGKESGDLTKAARGDTLLQAN